MCTGSNCNCSSCLACRIVRYVVALFLTFAAIASFLGVWATHHDAQRMWEFGTQAGSIAIAVFIFALMAWHKVTKKLCPCSRKGCGCGSGCGCGGSCDCGTGCSCGNPNCNGECAKKDGDMHQGMKM